MFREVPGRGLGINYDPSHLIRMGIDHTRFAAEFADRIAHVHAKDTEIITDNVYEIGLYQKSIFQKPCFCGEIAWRYTIPGHGVARVEPHPGDTGESGFHRGGLRRTGGCRL